MTHTGLLLVITRDETFGRALETVLAPAGYHVTRAPSPSEAIHHARIQAPDLLLLDAELLRTDAATTCARLRELPDLGRRTPLVVTSTGRLSPAERRDALRAGAWHLAEAPLNAEELILRLRVFVEAKREADRYRDAALWDPLTGLYTPRGIQHRALELAAVAARAQEPLACVVLSPAVAETTRAAVLDAVARALRELGRRSDAIGALGEGQFAVLAPATPAPGAARLAARLAGGVDQGLRPHLRAGFDVADTVDQPSVVAPRLIDHARQAAAEAMNGNGDGWLRKYRAG